VAAGSPIYTAHATDPDSAANGQVRYELIASTHEPSYFQVDRDRGTISLTHGLDYETVHRLTVTVVARDTGAPPLSDNMTLVVDVQDINDNPPVFERPHYAATVLESLPVNSQVSATRRRLRTAGRGTRSSPQIDGTIVFRSWVGGANFTRGSVVLEPVVCHPRRAENKNGVGRDVEFRERARYSHVVVTTLSVNC